jgi:hypothetical protein
MQIVMMTDSRVRRVFWPYGIQAQIGSAEWTRAAHFGQGDTPNGMRYRIYILSTKTDLPIGEITKQPENPRESPVITVTLRK